MSKKKKDIWDLLTIVELSRARQLKKHNTKDFNFEIAVDQIKAIITQLPKSSVVIEWFCQEEAAFAILAHGGDVELIRLDGKKLCQLVYQYRETYISIQSDEDQSENEEVEDNTWSYKKKWESKLKLFIDDLSKIHHDLVERINNFQPERVILIPSSIMNGLPLHLIFQRATSFQATIHNVIPPQSSDTIYKPLLISNDTNKDDLFEHEKDTLKALNFEAASRLDSVDYTSHSVIHVAHHARFDFADRDNICLIQSITEDGLNEETIGLSELSQHNFQNCALIFLSACEAGIIDPTDNLANYIGIAGIIAQQSKCVIAPLWITNEVSSVVFAVKFYDLLKQQSSKISISELLRQVQIWLKTAGKEEIDTLWKQISSKFEYGCPFISSEQVPFDSMFDWGAFACFGVEVYIFKDEEGITKFSFE